MPSFCHLNRRSSPDDLTVKVVGSPVATDLLFGCRVILGGSTVRKNIMVRKIAGCDLFNISNKWS